MPPYFPSSWGSLTASIRLYCSTNVSLTRNASPLRPAASSLCSSRVRQISYIHPCNPEETLDKSVAPSEAVKAKRRPKNSTLRISNSSSTTHEQTQEHGPTPRSHNPDRSRLSKPKLSSIQKNSSPSERHMGSDHRPVDNIESRPPREPWQIQKAALKKKFGEQKWAPRRKLSPDTIEGIRALHEQYPDRYTTPVLADHFKTSPEAIRRILKSKWRPSPQKMEERRVRWAKRHDRIWDAQAEMGLRPKRRKDRTPEKVEEIDAVLPLVPPIGSRIPGATTSVV